MGEQGRFVPRGSRQAGNSRICDGSAGPFGNIVVRERLKS